jgi:hypothetical protein
MMFQFLLWVTAVIGFACGWIISGVISHHSTNVTSVVAAGLIGGTLWWLLVRRYVMEGWYD